MDITNFKDPVDSNYFLNTSKKKCWVRKTFNVFFQ